MKHFALLLAFYTLYLVSAPCVDETMHVCGQDSGQTENENPGNQADHADACSPFCICSCCSVPVTIAPVTFIGQPYFSVQRHILPESSHFLSYFAVTFWQPPK